VTADPFGTYADRETVSRLVRIGTPLIGTNLSWRIGEFPLLAVVGAFGTPVVAAFVIAQRVRGLMNTPGWGFSLASSSLVGQELGTGDERTAESYGTEVIRFASAVYLLAAGLVFVLARPVALVFVGSLANPALPFATLLIRAACVAVVFQGISRAATGPLRTSGDTRWPFYGQMAGMYVFAIPLAYVGTRTPLGLWGVVLALVLQMLVPAIVNYVRFRSGKWKIISRAYRTPAGADD
jgi:Na+-driven multidrug efflux pump